MSLTFPLNPTPGQVYLAENGQSYTWVGNAWQATVLFNDSLTHLIPSADNTYDLGSTSSQWRSLYVSTGTIYIGGIPISINEANNTLVVGTTPGEEPTTATSLATESYVIDYVSQSITGTTTLPYLELTNDPFIFEPYAGEIVSFTKDDYATGSEAIDTIDTDIAITRGENQGIYNPLLELKWDDTDNDSPSPAATLWNIDGWTDLTNLNQRTYYSFYEAFDGGIGGKVLASEAVMKDVTNNKYYKFDFTVWGNNSNGAPVTYTRTELDPVTGDELGSPVEFVKAGYADPTAVNDPIGPGVTLTRGNNQGIFNIAIEVSYNSQGDGFDSPEGTEWNSDGWTNLKDVRQRNYGTFLETLGSGAVGENIVDKELVMHDTINDKYYAFKFSSWTQGGAGGGFAYTRQLINTSNLFVKPDNDTDTIDIFIPDDGNGAGVGITRGDNNGIYNPYREEGWDEDVSPDGTLWNIEGWNDLSDVTDRLYQPFYAAFGSGGLGNKVPGTECVMYVPDNEKYYAIKFLSWTQGGGGGFSYLRYELDVSQLNQGIKFADGTVLTSATGVGRVKLKSPNNRRIEEVYGYKSVSVTEVITNNLTGTASRIETGTNQIWIVTTSTTIDQILNDYSAAGIWDTSKIEFSVNNSDWYQFNGSTSGGTGELGYGISPATVSYNQGDTVYFRYRTGGEPVVWWNKTDLPGGDANFRGAIIDYHAYTGESTIIGTIHIVDDSGEEHITHTEVQSGSSDGENDDLWLVQNEGTVSYRRIDGENKTLKVQWTAKVFYGSEYYD